MAAERAVVIGLACLLVARPAGAHDSFWGEQGHLIVGGAAAAALPASMPAFFRGRAAQLRWLNPEPDRWRAESLPEMNEGFRYDHYIDLENVPATALRAEDRYAFLELLYRTTELAAPEVDAGFLPYRILELYQRLESGFRRWRAEPSPRERDWIEERIINDAGILGHYVADASQPHHTTIHFNGWAPGAPNPRGFTTARDFHSRFEASFVSAHVRLSDVRPLLATPRALGDPRTAVLGFIRATHGELETLYALEKRFGFDPGGPAAPATVDFTARRLAAGADMLSTLWYTAWVRSGGGSP